jgi:citrate lyase beta subunit
MDAIHATVIELLRLAEQGGDGVELQDRVDELTHDEARRVLWAMVGTAQGFLAAAAAATGRSTSDALRDFAERMETHDEDATH